MSKQTLAVLTVVVLTAASLQAAEKTPKIKSDDIPKNEKQLWKRIAKSQDELEANLMSGDPRFTAELDLTRRKVADLMLNAEGNKKSKAAVKDLAKAWNFWQRESDEIEVEDLKKYNLGTAAGKSFSPENDQTQDTDGIHSQSSNCLPDGDQRIEHDKAKQLDPGQKNYGPVADTYFPSPIQAYCGPTEINRIYRSNGRLYVCGPVANTGSEFRWRRYSHHQTTSQLARRADSNHQRSAPSRSAPAARYNSGGGSGRRR